MRRRDRLGVDICVKDRSVPYEQEALRRWEGELREMVSDLITLKADVRDEPALAWVLQNVVHGLVNIDIPGEMILRRVLAMLPCDVEEVPHRSTPQQNA